MPTLHRAGAAARDGGRTSFTTESTVQYYVGTHWLETSPGVFHSRYPAGLPLLMAGAWSWRASGCALLVNPLLASATILAGVLPRAAADGRLVCAVRCGRGRDRAGDQPARARCRCRTWPPRSSWCGARSRCCGSRSDAQLGPRAAAGVLLGIVSQYPLSGSVGGRRGGRVAPHGACAAVARRGRRSRAPCCRSRRSSRTTAAAYGAFGKPDTRSRTSKPVSDSATSSSMRCPTCRRWAGRGWRWCSRLRRPARGAGRRPAAPERRRAAGRLAVPLVLLYMAYYFGAGPGGGAGNHPVSHSTFPFLAVAAAWLLGILIVTSDRRPCGRRDRRRTAGRHRLRRFGADAGQTKASLASAARARELAGRRFRRAAS